MPGIKGWKMEDLERPDWIQLLPTEEHLLKFRLANGQIDPKLVEKDPVAAYKEMRQ